ncbi:MAG: tetratricopeptide repeat protein [Acidobacteriota bacterium]
MTAAAGVRVPLTVIGVLFVLSGCASEKRPTLLPVALPNLSRVDQAVQAQVRERYAALTERSQRTATPAADLASAYGALGMLLHASGYYDAAEPCYLNAQTLAPNELRWPYYLGHVFKSRGETAKAETAFERALALQPDDFPTLVWLGRLRVDEGRPEAAQPLFAKALTLSPQSVAALAGLGGVALAARDYRGAVTYLEGALAIDPGADSLHSPLAMAYRDLGELDKAEPHLRRWRNRELPVPDPLRQELDLLLESGLSYELRGVRALDTRAWPTAEEYFRRGLSLTPENSPLRRSLQHKLGTALFMAGDVKEAERQFEEVARAAPADEIDEASAKAHYSLAILSSAQGRRQASIEHLLAAVKYQPNYPEAQLALADSLRRSGRAGASLAAYKEALRLNPRDSPARLGYAVALSQLGRYLEARDWLTEATANAPDRPELKHALARLLATAPDDRVRDGRRALALVQELRKSQKTTDLGETMAMSLAELGEYEEAVSVQRSVLAASLEARIPQAVQRMTENLRLYERRQPCRIPWRPDEVSMVPGVAR